RVHYKNLLSTYDLSLAILFLDRLGDPRDKKLIRLFSFRLLTGQLSDGGWSYNCSSLTEQDQNLLYSLLKKPPLPSPRNITPVHEKKPGPGGPAALPPHLKALTVLQPPPKDDQQALANAGSDNSNPQFATLALWAARRHDVPLERTLAL